MLNYKKLRTIFVISAILLFIFSCSAEDPVIINNDADISETADGGADAVFDRWAQEPINLPEMDFEGRDFNVITLHNRDNRAWLHVTVEELIGDDIIDALYIRNLATEERFNITINEINVDNPSETSRRSILAGDSEYDLIIDNIFNVTSGFLFPHLLADLTEVPYIKDGLDKSWWDQGIKRDLAIRDRLFFSAGHIILRDKLRISSIFFNKGMFYTFGMEYPYRYVLEGTWTIDKLMQLTRGINADLDGDGVMGQYDRWGLLAETTFAVYAFEASGERMATLNRDRLPEITMNTPRAINVIQKALETVFAPESMFLVENITGTDNVWYRANQFFAEDRFLFRIGILEHVVRDLRHMPTDFGILPMFKFDEHQENYYSRMDQWGYVVGIPMNADLEFSGLITEALAHKSGSTLMPAFYDVCLATKHLRDDESEEMLDIIFNNRIYDLGYLFNIGGQQDMLGNMIRANSTDFVSEFERVRDRMQADLQRLIDVFDGD